ncbi:hypothetical protein [Streptomyces sp. C10-9-1]|uniref:hypothetical protein n=1 Tax=Streptomyces sp. C10-9-1 TaxID=1859285 RepID=UPI003F4A33D6
MSTLPRTCHHQQPPAEGEFVRGFRLHLRDGQVLDGAAFPAGRALVADDSEAGLVTAAGSVDQLLAGGYHGARLEWAPTAPAASTAPLAAGLPLVQGRCPACGSASLFLGDGGYVTCSRIDCPEPDAASTLLEHVPGHARALASMFDGLERLLATSSRDWQTDPVDAWLWAVLVGWDCEETEHTDSCVHGALEETAAMHDWDEQAVAKARRLAEDGVHVHLVADGGHRCLTGHPTCIPPVLTGTTHT